MGKWAPNDVQEVLLESLDRKLEGGQECRKFPLLAEAPQEKQNRATARMNWPTHCPDD